jgi:hypothetical protein
MKNENEHLEALNEIRNLMERSSRFISLSGLSGVLAGIFSLAGAAVAYKYLYVRKMEVTRYFEYAELNGRHNPDFYTFFLSISGIVLVLSLLSAYILTSQQAKKKGLSVWDTTARRLIINLMIPLAAGGIFCLILFKHGQFGLVAPCTLLFYGLGLVNASKYTLSGVRYLGMCEIVLGLVAAYYRGYGLFFWALGFGILHIIYGAVMYYKYER